MIKIKHKIGEITVAELLEFTSQFPDNRPLDNEFFDLLKAEVFRINNKNRIAKWRAKQRKKNVR
nr:MAG: hypothetical protein [Microvirus sp.]